MELQLVSAVHSARANRQNQRLYHVYVSMFYLFARACSVAPIEDLE